MTWDLVKHEFDRPQTAEERELGLDPSKYTRKPWRPQGGAPMRPQGQVQESPSGWELLKEREARDPKRQEFLNMIDQLGLSGMTQSEAQQRLQMLRQQIDDDEQRLQREQAEELGLVGPVSDAERAIIQQQMMMRLGGY